MIKRILDRLAYIASYDQACVNLVMDLTEEDRRIVKQVVEKFDSSKRHI